MKGILELLQEHRFFQGFSADHQQLMAGCGKNVHVKAGQYLAREGQNADQFYVIRKGKAGIELAIPPKGFKLIQTLTAGDIAGWSWLYPPYQWTFDVKALEDISAVALDGKCLRQKCEQDPVLGYSLMKAFAKIMTGRLKATRLQLVDVYGHSGDSGDGGLHA